MILTLIFGCMMQLCGKKLLWTDSHEFGESPTIRLQPSNSYRTYNATNCGIVLTITVMENVEKSLIIAFEKIAL